MLLIWTFLCFLKLRHRSFYLFLLTKYDFSQKWCRKKRVMFDSCAVISWRWRCVLHPERLDFLCVISGVSDWLFRRASPTRPSSCSWSTSTGRPTRWSWCHRRRSGCGEQSCRSAAPASHCHGNSCQHQARQTHPEVTESADWNINWINESFSGSVFIWSTVLLRLMMTSCSSADQTDLQADDGAYRLQQGRIISHALCKHKHRIQQKNAATSPLNLQTTRGSQWTRLERRRSRRKKSYVMLQSFIL